MRIEDGVLYLHDACPVEAAEEVLQALGEAPLDAVDLHDCTHLHTAVLQVILHVGLPIRRLPANPQLQSWLCQFVTMAPPATPLSGGPRA